jgi:putative solute:sodium symporter small subunit
VNGDISGESLSPSAPPKAWRWPAVLILSLGAMTALGIPLLARQFNLLVIAGTPLGFFLSALAVPVILALLAMAYAGLAGRGEPNDLAENNSQQ